MRRCRQNATSLNQCVAQSRRYSRLMFEKNLVALRANGKETPVQSIACQCWHGACSCYSPGRGADLRRGAGLAWTCTPKVEPTEPLHRRATAERSMRNLRTEELNHVYGGWGSGCGGGGKGSGGHGSNGHGSRGHGSKGGGSRGSGGSKAHAGSGSRGSGGSKGGHGSKGCGCG